jgi:hypothetical protein
MTQSTASGPSTCNQSTPGLSLGRSFLLALADFSNLCAFFAQAPNAVIEVYHADYIFFR